MTYDRYIEKHRIDKSQPYGLIVINSHEQIFDEFPHFDGFPLSWQLGNIRVAIIESVSTERYLHHRTTGVLSRVPYVAIGSSFPEIKKLCKSHGLPLKVEKGGVISLTYFSNGKQVLIKPVST